MENEHNVKYKGIEIALKQSHGIRCQSKTMLIYEGCVFSISLITSHMSHYYWYCDP